MSHVLLPKRIIIVLVDILSLLVYNAFLYSVKNTASWCNYKVDSFCLRITARKDEICLMFLLGFVWILEFERGNCDFFCLNYIPKVCGSTWILFQEVEKKVLQIKWIRNCHISWVFGIFWIKCMINNDICFL